VCKPYPTKSQYAGMRVLIGGVRLCFLLSIVYLIYLAAGIGIGIQGTEKHKV
jgi:hypothetical protein